MEVKERMSKSCRTAIDKSFCAMAVKEQLTTLNLKHDTMKVCQQCEYSLVWTIVFVFVVVFGSGSGSASKKISAHYH